MNCTRNHPITTGTAGQVLTLKNGNISWENMFDQRKDMDHTELIKQLKKESKEFWENMHAKHENIDDTFSEVTKDVNRAYEHLLHKIFEYGDYIFDLIITYKDVDGKTCTCSWQDRDKRIEWANGE